MRNLWWCWYGERPLPYERGLIIGQEMRLHGTSALLRVTRLVDGIAWVKATGFHASGAAIQEVAVDEVRRRPHFSHKDAGVLIQLLMRRFSLNEQSAATAVHAALQQ